ncbi:MAG: hypothetical protein Q8Q91_03390, partial [Candidatus Daviesbacteria bacterium]|nr:hypothetical protein [Candidatus Daviesbacteria bacterium]
MNRLFVTGAPGWLGSRFVETHAKRIQKLAPFVKNQNIRCFAIPNSNTLQLKEWGAEIAYGD